MKQVIRNRKWLLAVSTFFILPAAYFITSSILKFELGFPGLYDLAEPLLITLGLKEQIGLNINGLIVFGPVVAMTIALFTILNIKWENQKDSFSISLAVRKSPMNVFVAIMSASPVIFLLLYAIGENCNC